MLVGILALVGATAGAQESSTKTPRFAWTSSDLAMTFTTEQSKTFPGSGGNFFALGGSIDAGATFLHGWGWAGNITVEHASRIAPGFNLRETDIMTGPRYTYRKGGKHENRLFGELFVGEAHATDPLFPTSKGFTDKANAFAWQAGGGWDLSLSKHFALRAIEVDFVRTYLPNGGSNNQNHIRLAVGLEYHIPNH